MRMMFILKRMLTFTSCFGLIIVRARRRNRLARRGGLAWRATGIGEGGIMHARPGCLDVRGELEVLARDKRAAGALDLGLGQHAQMCHDARRVGAVDVHLAAPVDERPVQVRAQKCP